MELLWILCPYGFSMPSDMIPSGFPLSAPVGFETI